MTARATEEASARATRAKQEEEPIEVSGINRREFLYYIWGASMVMLLGAGSGTLIWYMLPRFREGEFGGDFPMSGSVLPAQAAAPQDNPQGRFWLSHTDEGQVMALYKVCTHLGCLFKWVGTNNRFECPCHGSKFQANGLFIEGPAPRGLDRFELTMVLDDGTELVSDENGIIEVEDPGQVSELIVHTGRKVTGPPAGVDEYTSA